MRAIRVLVIALVAVAEQSCWAQHESHDQFLNFKTGMSKMVAFSAALESQRAGRITNLEVIGDDDETHDEKYRGDPILPRDFDRVESFDEWHSGLPGCNCWVRLHFSNGRLKKIVSHEWTGPTE